MRSYQSRVGPLSNVTVDDHCKDTDTQEMPGEDRGLEWSSLSTRQGKRGHDQKLGQRLTRFSLKSLWKYQPRKQLDIGLPAFRMVRLYISVLLPHLIYDTLLQQYKETNIWLNIADKRRFSKANGSSAVEANHVKYVSLSAFISNTHPQTHTCVYIHSHCIQVNFSFFSKRYIWFP